MQVILIAATDQNGLLGVNGTIPWRVPGELKHFRENTQGHVVIMGRGTFESLNSKPLPGRTNIVLSTHFREGVSKGGSDWLMARKLTDALKYARDVCHAEKCFIIGGVQAYLEAEPYANKLIHTEIALRISVDLTAGDEAVYVNFSDTWGEPQSTYHYDGYKVRTYCKQPELSYDSEVLWPRNSTSIDNLTRYNQGFGRVGPLEMCNTGELVKFADVKKLFREVKENHESSEELLRACVDSQTHTIADRDRSIQMMKDRLDTERKLFDDLRKSSRDLRDALIEDNERSRRVAFLIGITVGAIALNLILKLFQV